MFSYACPFCSQRLLAPPERVGQRTICPKCLRPLIIPAPEPSAVGEASVEVEFTESAKHELNINGVDLGAEVGRPRARAEGSSLADVLVETPPAAAEYPDRTPEYPSERVPERHESWAPERPQRAGDWALPTRPLPAVTPRRASLMHRSETGMVSLHPTGMAAVDIGAELTANLTMRMKPPPEPPADLRLSTAAWLVLFTSAIALWLAAVLYEPLLLKFVALLGALMVAFAYLWAAHLAGQRDWLRGVVTLLPPVALWRLARPFGENGYRPLRFALTGLLALALYAVGPATHAALEPVVASLDFGRGDQSPVAAVAPRDQLREAAATKPPEAVVRLVMDLGEDTYLKTLTPEERQGLAAELLLMTRTTPADRLEIRLEALKSLVACSPADARTATLAALRSPEGMERRAALDLAPRWPDAEVAQAVAARLGHRGEEVQAREVLLHLPAPLAEAALLGLLTSDDPLLVLTAADLLEAVGGPPALAKLRGVSKTASNTMVRTQTARHAAALERRLGAGRE